MIQEVNNRIARAKSDIHVYDNGDPMNFLRLFTDREELVHEVTRHTQVRERLVRYYADTMSQIIEPVIIKTLNNGSIPSGATGTQTPGEAFLRTSGSSSQVQGTIGQTGKFVCDKRVANCGK
jgi:hypothetical protein